MRTFLILLLFLLAAPAWAQEAGAGPKPASPASSAIDTAAADAFAAANAALLERLEFDHAGDPDIAFARRMIAHHQGAVDTANVILQFGEDEELATYARKIIADRSAEIAWLRAWLAKHGAE